MLGTPIRVALSQICVQYEGTSLTVFSVSKPCQSTCEKPGSATDPTYCKAQFTRVSVLLCHIAMCTVFFRCMIGFEMCYI